MSGWADKGHGLKTYQSFLRRNNIADAFEISDEDAAALRQAREDAGNYTGCGGLRPCSDWRCVPCTSRRKRQTGAKR